MLVPVILLVTACVSVSADITRSHLDLDDDDEYSNEILYRYNEEASSSTKAMTSTYASQTPVTRVKRFDETTPALRTLSADEVIKVKDLLKGILSDGNIKNVPPNTTDLATLIDIVSSTYSELVTDGTQFTFMPTTGNYRNSSLPALRQYDKTPPPIAEEVILNYFNVLYMYHKYTNFYLKTAIESYHSRHASPENCMTYCLRDSKCKSFNYDKNQEDCHLYQTNKNETRLLGMLTSNSLLYSIEQDYYEILRGTIVTTTVTTTTVETTTIEVTTKRKVIDIAKLVAIIANLTMNTIESNLTEMFNATLQKYGIPMCGDTTTTEAPTYDFANATIISKCFVCGLDTPGIPHNAFCADAFSGDFLPLVPVDPRAKGQIAKYRKYCRYLDVPGMLTNETQPRSVFGRWTGGCSVRWIDLSGVYTQRACRNRRHATMGKHYVSKRMAKLEMALKNEDNGCIISPMSSLVPLARSISLYARFHACVCTGSWCNGARARTRYAWLTALTSLTAVVLTS